MNHPWKVRALVLVLVGLTALSEEKVEDATDVVTGKVTGVFDGPKGFYTQKRIHRGQAAIRGYRRSEMRSAFG